MIDEATIDRDADGFALVLVGDLATPFERYLDTDEAGVTLRLTPDSAIQLVGAVRNVLGPWAYYAVAAA